MDCYRVEPGSRVSLSKWDPDDKQFCPDGKQAGLKELDEIKRKLYALQVKLFAEHKNKLMVVLQGMDTSGKDGTIRNVFGGLDPQGVKVATFAKPSTRELDHDYLWRIHLQVPCLGQIAIFNRSHYEDVLAVRVRHLMPKNVWAKRYGHINDFERMLSDEGVTILKLFLHISNEEQRQRLISRRETPHKQWKLIPQDVEDRKLWPDYTEAYEDCLSKTSTRYAPWYVIPANRKWYRNLIVSTLVYQTLEKINPSYPAPDYDVAALEI